MNIKILLILTCLIPLFSSLAFAQEYAPLLDTSHVKNAYFSGFDSKDLPDISEVPVEAYVPASLLYVSNINSTGDSQFQENRVHLRCLVKSSY